MQPLTLTEYREREKRNPAARPITQQPIQRRNTLSDDELAARLAARGHTPVKLNPHTRRPPKETTT